MLTVAICKHQSFFKKSSFKIYCSGIVKCKEDDKWLFHECEAPEERLCWAHRRRLNISELSSLPFYSCFYSALVLVTRIGKVITETVIAIACSWWSSSFFFKKKQASSWIQATIFYIVFCLKLLYGLPLYLKTSVTFVVLKMVFLG